MVIIEQPLYSTLITYSFSFLLIIFACQRNLFRATGLLFYTFPPTVNATSMSSVELRNNNFIEFTCLEPWRITRFQIFFSPFSLSLSLYFLANIPTELVYALLVRLISMFVNVCRDEISNVLYWLCSQFQSQVVAV